MQEYEIRGWFSIPLSLISDLQRDWIIEKLSYISHFENEEGYRKSISMYELTDSSINVPVEWARITLPSLYNQAVDLRVFPENTLNAPLLPSPDHPRVKDPIAQRKLMDDLNSAVLSTQNVLLSAKTGSGKTVCALRQIALLKTRAVIIVPTEALRDQWVEEIQSKLGISRDKIGIVQQKKCETEGKEIVVAIMASLARRSYPDLYQWAGVVVYDECHRLSTEHLNAVLPKFDAKYRIGVSATIKRKDGSDTVLYNHLGEISVIGETTVMNARVMVVPYNDGYKEKEDDILADRQVNFRLARSKKRNQYLADVIVDFYNAGRQILVVSNSVDHLEKLLQLVAMKVSKDDLGQFTAKYSNGKKVSKEEKAIALSKRIVFATDGLIKEGVDEARLDVLVEAVAFWNVTQRLGRVRRFMNDKPTPVCVTLRDVCYKKANDMYYARMREYAQEDSEIIEAG